MLYMCVIMMLTTVYYYYHHYYPSPPLFFFNTGLWLTCYPPPPPLKAGSELQSGPGDSSVDASISWVLLSIPLFLNFYFFIFIHK